MTTVSVSLENTNSTSASAAMAMSSGTLSLLPQSAPLGELLLQKVMHQFMAHAHRKLLLVLADSVVRTFNNKLIETLFDVLIRSHI